MTATVRAAVMMFGLHVDYPPCFVSSKFDFASFLCEKDRVEEIVWPRPPRDDPVTLHRGKPINKCNGSGEVKRSRIRKHVWNNCYY